jgi:hypothetical protein
VRNTHAKGGDEMTNCERLNELIKGSDYPVNVIASKVGMTTQSLHNKRTGKREFTIKEMLGLCEVLDISDSERDEIFLR